MIYLNRRGFLLGTSAVVGATCLIANRPTNILVNGCDPLSNKVKFTVRNLMLGDRLYIGTSEGEKLYLGDPIDDSVTVMVDKDTSVTTNVVNSDNLPSYGTTEVGKYSHTLEHIKVRDRVFMHQYPHQTHN